VSDPRIPDKQYFRIGEVAKIADVEPYVLRFWETEFGSLRPQKSRSNHRMYARKDVEHVLRIRDLLYEEGYTIVGARHRLREPGADAGDPLDHPRSRGLLARIRKEVEELLQAVDE
jgi:DNA-binding transcriptional MerR regulator